MPGAFRNRNTHDLQIGGNTAGVTALIYSGTVTFAGGNNVTLSQAGNAITISAGAGGGGSLNLSAGATSQNLTNVVFNNSNGVSFGLTGSTVTATVATNYQSAGAYLTTAALSADTSNYAGINGAITGGSITVNTSGVSVNLPAYLTTAQAPGAYLTTAALSNHSHGNPTLALTNLTGTTASASNGFTLSLSGNAAGGGDAIRGIAAGASTATTNTVNFSNSNGISFGWGAVGNSTVITGVGSGVTSTKGTYGKMFRPGDSWEFVSDAQNLIYVDLSKFWINNDAVTGFAGDGFAILNPAWE